MKDKDTNAMSGKTDERAQGHWKSRYPKEAIKQQIKEAIYLTVLLVVAFTVIFLNYTDTILNWIQLSEEKQLVFTRMVTCVSCGLLGGTIFDIKWFYRAIAHGFWNLDRIYWRIFTPIISMTFAFCMACIFSQNIIIYGSGFTAATLGFLAGYFSDEAVGKMAEVAKLLFNTNEDSKKKSSSTKHCRKRGCCKQMKHSDSESKR